LIFLSWPNALVDSHGRTGNILPPFIGSAMRNGLPPPEPLLIAPGVPVVGKAWPAAAPGCATADFQFLFLKRTLPMLGASRLIC
jgi:hypothetical protein